MVRWHSPQVETAEPALSEVEWDVDEAADFDARAFWTRERLWHRNGAALHPE